MLKEDSTAYVSAWVKKYVWRVPGERPSVSKRRVVGYAIYAITCGAYSYSLLFLVANFVGNVARNYSPEWGFLFGLMAGYRIFRSRIHKLVRFMHTVYLDKKERVLSWFSRSRASVAGVALAALLVLPLLRGAAETRAFHVTA